MIVSEPEPRHVVGNDLLSVRKGFGKLSTNLKQQRLKRLRCGSDISVMVCEFCHATTSPKGCLLPSVIRVGFRSDNDTHQRAVAIQADFKTGPTAGSVACDSSVASGKW